MNDLGSIPGFAQDGATIQLRLPSSIPSQAELNFVSSNLTLHLYYDGEEAYAFDPVHSPTEHPYATHFNFAPLSVNDAGKLARLELRPAYTDMNARLVSVRIAETSAYIQDYVTSHGFALIESLVTVFIGFTVIAFDIVLRKIKHGQLDLLALGSAIILMGIWSITVTKVFQLITGQEALVGALEYMSLLFVPYPVACFASSLLLPHKRKRFNVIARVIAIGTIALTAIFATVLGVDMHCLLPTTHVHLLSCAVIVAVEVAVTLHERVLADLEEDTVSYNAILIAFLIFMACAIADFVVFVTSKLGVSDSAFFVRHGLFVFSAVLSAEAARASLAYVTRAAYADKVEVIAYTDGLTGIGNRTAFKVLHDQVEAALASGELKEAAVCQLDVNFLKRVNDTYGHAAGDRYIKHAANTIKRSLGMVGSCFRTGGDEFSVVFTGDDLEDKIAHCTELFELSLSEQNVAHEGDVAISIAMGIANTSEVEPRTLREAQKLADSRMYENKRAMKAERVD